MLKLWGRSTSSNVQKALWALEELGLPYERIDVGGAFGKLDTAEFGAMNPARQIPVLEDNGFYLGESNAVIRYLAETYGRGTLGSQDRRTFARADQWMDWTATSIQPDIIGTIFWGLIRTPAAERNQAAIDVSIKRAGERLAIADAQLAKHAYLMGETLSMADIPLGSLMYRYYTLPIARAKLPNLDAWYARLQARPAYAKAVMTDYSGLKVAGA
jgi:glutathione S-transferase